jgi:hypothetical protein
MRSVLLAMRAIERDSSQAAIRQPKVASRTATPAASAARRMSLWESADSSTIGTAAAIT